jgi:hypothetical protein
MKRTIFSLAAVALLAVGCAENSTTEVNPVIKDDLNAIGFEMGTSKTRTDISDLEGDENGFKVFAIGADYGELIENKVYKYTGSAWDWLDAEANWQKWPTAGSTDYPLSFYAYYPTTSAPNLNVASISPAVLINAQYQIAEDNEANLVDYLAANHTGVNARPANGKVKLDFKHILSKIDFAVAAGPGVTVEVQSIKIHNIRKAGVFNYASLSWYGNAGDGDALGDNDFTYTYLKAADAVDNSAIVAATDPVDINNVNGSLLLMPQDLDDYAWEWNDNTPGYVPALSTDSYIEVVYRVWETNGNEDVVGYGDSSNHPDWDTSETVHDPHDQTKHPADNTNLFVKVGYELGGLWQMNTAYKYILKLGDPTKTGGYLIEENFIDEDGNETDLPVISPGSEDPYPDVPDPIYPESDEIGFTVSTSTWDNETAEDLEF